MSELVGIGDVTSSTRGSGARYNAGKPPMHLIPLYVLAECYDHGGGELDRDVRRALRHLGLFQRTGSRACLTLAIRELEHAIEDCAHVFDYGRAKYAEWNWAKGMPWSVPLACFARHAVAILRDEEIDPESGLPHRGHLLCNLVMLLHYVDHYPEGNDLPPRELFTTTDPAKDAR